jgi:hypothetical protein
MLRSASNSSMLFRGQVNCHWQVVPSLFLSLLFFFFFTFYTFESCTTLFFFFPFFCMNVVTDRGKCLCFWNYLHLRALSHPSSRKQNRSLRTCVQDVQITRTANNMVNRYNISLNYRIQSYKMTCGSKRKITE